jgi:hypothetical protein
MLATLLRQTPGRLLLAFGVLILAFAGAAQACAICFSGMSVTAGQRLDSADQAVLAVPLAERGQFRIIEVIKGDAAAQTIITGPASSAPPNETAMSPDGPLAGQGGLTAADGKPLLLVRDKLSEEWKSIGAISAGYADWLRRIAATKHDGEARPTKSWPPAALMGVYLSDAEWRERVAIVAPNFESAEPLVAEIAYGELARAPYGAIHVLKSQLDAAKIVAWISDPKLVSRRLGYTLLLGIAGGPDHAARLEKQIDTALKAHDTANLSAMLAADLELRGPSRVDWLEQTYFADRQRTLPEIEAALLALSVHGGADATISRARVVAAYRDFIKMRKPMAGFVAMELADWGAWDATSDYVDIIKSKTVKDPAGEFAILSYLQRSPETSRVAALNLPTSSGE